LGTKGVPHPPFASPFETLSQFSAPNVRNERHMEEAERCSNTSTGFIVQAVEGTPARELELIATHRLGLDTGG
jgi:hypothetical protein